jgi:peptidyl-prolyl cis-trans isomerase SurA
MMRGLMSGKGWALALVVALLSAPVVGQGLRSPAPAQGVRAASPVDGIAAVVNRSVITVREVDERAQTLRAEIRDQGIAPPSGNQLTRDALEALITDTLIQQQAELMRIVITPQDVAQAIEVVARRNNVTVAQLRSRIQSLGFTWADYEKRIQRDLVVERLRQRIAETTTRISDAEVDAFLNEQTARKASGLEPPPPPPPPPPKPQPVQPLVMQLSQIFIRVPESATEEQVAQSRKRIDEARARVRKGEKFDAVAIELSEGPEASRGGDLGVRPAQGWPTLFLNAARNLQPGQMTGVIRSPAGFHIIQVVGRAGGQPPAPPPPPPQPTRGAELPSGPLMVEQTKARHILIKTTAVMSDDQARQRLENARSRIVQGGETFEQVARAVSDDISAPQGGDLGWINPGETVPEFEKAMQALKPGEVSEPVKSPFGWHLILVQERRTQDMADQYKRNMARQALFGRRAETGFNAWLQQIRNQAFIDNRLFRPSNQ